MLIKNVAGLTGGKIVCGLKHIDDGRTVNHAFSSDLMSDVLTVDSDNLLLITGLTNMQTIRTAEMSDITAILFVRNKKVGEEMIELAEELNMILMECPKSMYAASGILYKAGLKEVY